MLSELLYEPENSSAILFKKDIVIQIGKKNLNLSYYAIYFTLGTIFCFADEVFLSFLSEIFNSWSTYSIKLWRFMLFLKIQLKEFMPWDWELIYILNRILLSSWSLWGKQITKKFTKQSKVYGLLCSVPLKSENCYPKYNCINTIL